MLYLYRSNSPGWLAEQLHDTINKAPASHPLQSVEIIVPNRDNARWLQFQFASLNEISANIRYLLPAEWMWNEIRNHYPETASDLASDKDPMQCAILNLILNRQLPENAHLLQNYIKMAPDQNKTIRYWELSKLIASVFDKYIMHRPGMLMSWQNEKLTTSNRDEIWQMNLWRILNDYWNKLYANEIEFSKISLWKNLLLGIKRGDVHIKSNKELRVFHPGLLPKPVTELLAAFAKQIPVYLVCNRIADSTSKKTGLSSFLNEMILEEKAFDETLYFFSKKYDLKPVEVSQFHLRDSGNFLRFTQKGILSGDLKSGKPAVPDSSVRIHSCHSKLREIETLHQYLLDCFEQSATLRPDDVAVVSPDIDQYAPFIKAVFGTKDGTVPAIPFSLAGDRQNDSAETAEVFEHFLQFIDSRWFPSDFMDLLHNGPVMEKFELSNSELSVMRGWLVENSVTWGFDQKHRCEHDQPENDTNTFHAALNRLWSGHLYASGDFTLIDDIPAFRGIDSSEMDEVLEKFSTLLTTLNKFRSELKKDQTVSEWCEQAYIFMNFLFPAGSNRYPVSAVSKVIETVEEQNRLAGFNQPVPFSLFRQQLLSGLVENRSSAVNLAGGVVFSSMVPLRNLPFKIVAMIGLNEDQFPRHNTVPEFDLIHQEPKPHETTVKDEDRHLFIQYVMSATEKLYMSYTGRSPVDNENIPPSVILEKWLDIIRDITGVERNQLVTEEPLTGFSESLFMENRSHSQTYADLATAVIAEHKKSGIYLDSPMPFREPEQAINLQDLISFFQHPLKTFLRTRYGIRLSDFDDQLGNERFVPDALLNYRLTGPLLTWQQKEVPPGTIQKFLLRSGFLPDGLPGTVALETAFENTQNILDHVAEKTGDPKRQRIIIDIHLNGPLLTGYIETYSKHGYMDVFLSAASGKNRLTAWIRYLTLLIHFETKEIENHVLFDAKKNKGKWESFKTVHNAKGILETLIDIYLNGLNVPFLFAPKTAFELVYRNESESGFSPDAIRKAEDQWHGGKYMFAEKDDPVYKLWLARRNLPEEPEFQKNATAVFRDLIDHMG
ncbi:MAG: exodeoxyribonuclease V subunit gamma [Balneolaceae bacterium]